MSNLIVVVLHTHTTHTHHTNTHTHTYTINTPTHHTTHTHHIHNHIPHTNHTTHITHTTPHHTKAYILWYQCSPISCLSLDYLILRVTNFFKKPNILKWIVVVNISGADETSKRESIKFNFIHILSNWASGTQWWIADKLWFLSLWHFCSREDTSLRNAVIKWQWEIYSRDSMI